MPQQGDVFHQIRTQFDNSFPSLPACPDRKVLARNDVCFITELPEKWRIDYDRRNRHRHTGFFAHSHVPYRTFGNLKHTDAYDLVSDHLGVTITKQVKAYHLSHRLQDHDEYGDFSDPQQMIRVVRDTTQRQPLLHSRHAGLSTIRLVLGGNQRSMREMNAGSTFRDSQSQEEERTNFLQEIRTPKPVRAKGGPTSVYNPSLYLSPMVHTASSKACLTLTDLYHKKPPQQKPQKQEKQETCVRDASDIQSQSKTMEKTVGPNLFVALAAVQFKLHHTRDQEHRHQMNEARRQMRRRCMARLKSVYAILCCLHNIKMRDLRSREPLTPAALKAYSQKPLHSLTKEYLHHDTHHFHHHHPHHHLPPLTHTPGHIHHHTKFGPHTSTPHPHMHTHHGEPHDTCGSPTPGEKHHGVHHKHPHTHKQGHGVPRNVRKQTEHQAEMWEDLVAMDTLCGEGRTQTSTHGGPSLACSLPTRAHSNPHLHHMHGIRKHTRATPPWQRQVIYVDAEDENGQKDPAKQLRDCINAFQHAKNKMAQEMRDVLSERKQHIQKHLVTKLQELPLGASVQDCLEYMRERAYQISRKERAEEENKPAWFVQLEKETSSTFDGRDKDGKAVLEKLKQLLCVDNNAIPHVVEKLCLLVMSLPANQLSLQPIMSAIQFVLEHVLKASPKLCAQWLELRGLPCVSTELTSFKSVEGDGTCTLLKSISDLDIGLEPSLAFALDDGAVMWMCEKLDACTWVTCDTENDDNRVIVWETECLDYREVAVCLHCGLVVVLPSEETRRQCELHTLKLIWSTGISSKVSHQLRLPDSFSLEKCIPAIVLPNQHAEKDDEGFCKAHNLVLCLDDGIVFYNFPEAGISDPVKVLRIRPRDEYDSSMYKRAFALSRDKKLAGVITSNQKFHIWRLDSDEYAYHVLPAPLYRWPNSSCFAVGHLYSVLNCGDTVKVVATFTGEELLSCHNTGDKDDVYPVHLWGPADVTWLNDFSYYPKSGLWHISALSYNTDSTENDIFERRAMSLVACT